MIISYIFDTYAKTSREKIMHFDVILDDKDTEKALEYPHHGLKAYVKNKLWLLRRIAFIAIVQK